MKTSKLLSAILAAVIFSLSIFAVPSTAESASHSGLLGMRKLSKAEVVSLTRDVLLSDTDNFYVTQPSVVYPYSMGEVKAEVQTLALNRFNNYRRLAGLGSVTIYDEYTMYAQGAAVVNAANNVMTHYPTKPSDMPDNFFKICEYGDCHCNIADYIGYHPSTGPLCFSVDLWMDDSDNYNIAQLGHRRWMLNPDMGKTGFGCATSTEQWIHTAIYAFDNSITPSDYDFISWPPSGYMVNDTDFFTTNCAWSVSLNPKKYNVRNLTAADVTITDSNGRRWSFTGNGNDDGFFNIDLNGYGSTRNAIIFRPDGIKKYDGVYTVKITNLETADKTPTTLVYTVEFFGSDDADIYETTTVPPTTVPPTTEPPTTVPPTTEPPTTEPPTTEPPTTEPPTTEPPTTEPPTTEPPTTEPPTTEPPTTEPPTTEPPTTEPPTTEPPTTEPPTTEPPTTEKPSAITPDFMKGDVTADKRITASDARAALRFAAKIDVPSAEQFRAADVNADGKLNAMDARLILRVAAKLDVFEEETESESNPESEIIPSEPANDDVSETTTQKQDPATETTTQETTLPIKVEIIVTTEESTASSLTTTAPSVTSTMPQTTIPPATTEKPVITTSATPVTTTKVRPNDDDAVVVIKSTGEYHDLECFVLLYGDDEIAAMSLEDAKKNNYTPCRHCIY